MKKYIPIAAALACMLASASDSQAFFRRSVEKVVVRNQPQKVVVQQQKVVIKEVQQVIVKDVQEVQIREIKRIVAQPVQLLQNNYGYGQAVQIQPVQAFYRVEQLSSGYGSQALNLGSACSQSAAQIRELQQQVQQLQQAEVQRLQAERQRLTAPMSPPK